jgi:hypothetical protein
MKGKKILLSISMIIIVFISGFVIWGYTPPKPMDEAITALDSDENVTVNSEKWYTFTPKNITPTVGFIFYPGGRVDPRSYAPSAKAIAEAGFLVIIVPMPLNLAVTGVNKANQVIEEFPSIQKWAIGGHSLGGAMAAQYLASNPSDIDGLIFWASYPAQNLSAINIPVLSISGTLDGLSTPEKIEVSRSNLPITTQWVAIEGANHAQFGYYGDQSGDNVATLTRTEQQTQIINVTQKFLAKLN